MTTTGWAGPARTGRVHLVAAPAAAGPITSTGAVLPGGVTCAPGHRVSWPERFL